MKKSPNNYCVILAGGIGSRLWPVSRVHKPKQFLDLFGTGRTLLQQTYDRFAHFIDPANIYVSTNREYVDMVCEQLPQVPEENILSEPIRRNTLASVAWAASLIHHRCPKANIVASPADQMISNEVAFGEDILGGLDFVAQTEALLTIGVKPTRPDTGYGYIQVGDAADSENFALVNYLGEQAAQSGNTLNAPIFARVKSFTEKPELEFAKMFMESGEFYWNTGLFLWNADVMIRAIVKLVPNYADEIREVEELEEKREAGCMPECFSALPNLSLDYGILERSDNVYVQQGRFGWADLGNWWSLHDDALSDEDGNVVLNTEAMLYKCKGNVVRLPEGRIAVLDGLENFVVAEEGNVLMICPKSDAASMRRMMTDAQMKLGEELG